MITTITLNPTIDKTVYITKLAANDTNRVTRVEIDAGGKGINCSRMLKRLGAETTVVAFLGGTTGDFVATVLDKEGVALECVPTDKPTRSCICVEESASGLPPTTSMSAVDPSNIESWCRCWNWPRTYPAGAPI